VTQISSPACCVAPNKPDGLHDCQKSSQQTLDTFALSNCRQNRIDLGSTRDSQVSAKHGTPEDLESAGLRGSSRERQQQNKTRICEILEERGEHDYEDRIKSVKTKCTRGQISTSVFSVIAFRKSQPASSVVSIGGLRGRIHGTVSDRW